MGNIWAIVTHHKHPDEASDAWKREGVCAIGWSGYGDLRRVSRRVLEDDSRFAKAREMFLEIRRGDIVLAYSTRNTISHVGEVVGQYSGQTRDNEVGEEPLEYANQLNVKWWEEPHHFSRFQLPSWLANQLGKRGITVVKMDLGKHGFSAVAAIIRQCAISGSALDEIEDLVKAGLRKHLHDRIDDLEHGLKITKAERFTSKSERPDFIATDKKGRTVIIECKGTGHAIDCEQIENYGKRSKADSPRMMSIAFEFSPRCKKEARSRNVELVECDLGFTRL